MNSSAKNNDGLRRVPVEWQDAPAVGPLPIVQRRLRRAFRMLLSVRRSPRLMIQLRDERSAGFSFRAARAFTLLELMMVIAIIGFIAGLMLSHVGNFTHANSMTTATRQLLDDVALARQRAMANRSTVYMVFLPPGFWVDPNYTTPALGHGYLSPKGNQITNLVMHQYTAYALVSLSTVGDQPGKHTPKFITDWRVLPDGIVFAPMEFNNVYTNLVQNGPFIFTNIYTTNTLSQEVFTNSIYPWTTNYFPFPSAYPPNISLDMPCIGFSPRGGLTTKFDQSIVLARGSVFYPTDTNGVPIMGNPPATPNLAITPPGNDVNNPNIIQIDWLTGRATLMQNKLQ